MGSRMKPAYPVGTPVIHTDGDDYEFKGVVSRAKRVKGQDFYTYDIMASGKRKKGESEWQEYPWHVFNVSDYSLTKET